MGACGSTIDQGDGSGDYSDDDSYEIESDESSQHKSSPGLTSASKRKSLAVAKRKSIAIAKRKSAVFTNPVLSDDTDGESDDPQGGGSSKKKNGAGDAEKDYSPVSITDAISSNVNPLENQRLIQNVYRVEKSAAAALPPPRLMSLEDLSDLLVAFYSFCDRTVESAKIAKQASKYHSDCRGIVKYLTKKYGDEFPQTVAELEEKLAPTIVAQERQIKKSGASGSSGSDPLALVPAKRPTLNEKALKELARAQVFGTKKRRLARADRNARVAECRAQLERIQLKATGTAGGGERQYVQVLMGALTPGQRVRTTSRCINLYLKPGQVGTYLQRFHADPEGTGLFEWVDWIHPLSNRSTFAVPFVDIELDEEPNTDDDDDDEHLGEDDAVEQLQRKMSLAALSNSGTNGGDDSDSSYGDAQDQKAARSQDHHSVDSDDADAVGGADVDISSPPANTNQNPAGPGAAVSVDHANTTPKAAPQLPATGAALTPSQLIMSRILAVERANSNVADVSSSSSDSDSEEDAVTRRRREREVPNASAMQGTGALSEDFPPTPDMDGKADEKKRDNPFASDGGEDEATNPFRGEGVDADNTPEATPAKKVSNPFDSDADDGGDDASSEGQQTGNPFASDEEIEAPNAARSEAIVVTEEANPFASPDPDPGPSTASEVAPPTLPGALEDNDAAVQTVRLLEQGAITRDEFDNIIESMLTAAARAADTTTDMEDSCLDAGDSAAPEVEDSAPTSPNSGGGGIVAVAAAQLKQGVITQAEHDQIVATAQKAALSASPAGAPNPFASDDDDAEELSEGQAGDPTRNPFDDSDDEPSESSNTGNKGPTNPFESSEDEGDEPEGTNGKSGSAPPSSTTAADDSSNSSKRKLLDEQVANPFTESDDDEEPEDDKGNAALEAEDPARAQNGKDFEAPTPEELKLLELIGDDEDFNLLMCVFFQVFILVPCCRCQARRQKKRYRLNTNCLPWVVA